jgi:hypothetical protein
VIAPYSPASRNGITSAGTGPGVVGWLTGSAGRSDTDSAAAAIRAFLAASASASARRAASLAFCADSLASRRISAVRLALPLSFPVPFLPFFVVLLTSSTTTAAAATTAGRTVRVTDVDGQRVPQCGGVLGGQVDLVLNTVECESHRLVRRTSVQIVEQLDHGFACHGSPCIPT